MESVHKICDSVMKSGIHRCTGCNLNRLRVIKVKDIRQKNRCVKRKQLADNVLVGSLYLQRIRWRNRRSSVRHFYCQTHARLIKQKLKKPEDAAMSPVVMTPVLCDSMTPFGTCLWLQWQAMVFTVSRVLRSLPFVRVKTAENHITHF